MKRHLIIFTVLSLLVFGFATVYAQPSDRPRGMGMARDSFPEFTKAQLQQMDQLRLENQKTMIPLRADLQLQMVEYRDMLHNNASQADLNAKLDKIGQLKIQISKARLDNRLKMRGILTDQQREFIDSHRGMGQGFFNHEGMRQGHQGRQGRMFDRMNKGDNGWQRFRGDSDNEDDGGMMGFGFMGMNGDCPMNCTGPCMQK